MFASVRSTTLLGVVGRAVDVEVHVGVGLPGFTIVGQPDEVCRESRDRVRAAFLSRGFAWPNRRITVNLAPSGERKGGAGLDLAIAVAVLVADEQLSPDAAQQFAFVAELGLDGSLRSVVGAAPLVSAVRDRRVVVAAGNVAAARAAGAADVVAASDLAHAIACLRGDAQWLTSETSESIVNDVAPPDLSDVRGQPVARLALEVAAAGAHHLLLVGPPGAGKSMLARRLPGILPPLRDDEALSCTMVHSAAHVSMPPSGRITRAPFRSPHHSISMVGLIGGGTSAMRPGEISLASEGVLFLDELGEFAPSVLDALRQPIEEGVVRVSRARTTLTFPARFLLVAAANPCPCGAGTPGVCVCDDAARAKYLRRFSGPLLDRFDLRVSVGLPRVDDLVDGHKGESSSSVAARVVQARALAAARNGDVNSKIAVDDLDTFAPLARAARALLRRELEAGRLSGRGLHRVRRVARTIADLNGAPAVVEESHVATALQLRTGLATLAGGVR
ncbi:MAG: YifB family Mg chelatase-like AAA ATPase [Ilumatobacteraceae bacterium]